MSNPIQQLFSRLFAPMIEARVREKFTVKEQDSSFLVGTRHYDESERDRLNDDREAILAQCLDAWRENPLARRIVELTSHYVVGTGCDIQCDHKPTRHFLADFWNHRLNRMTSRLVELCDELTRTGNLFLLVSTDPSGMSFIRALPAGDIDRITASENDIEQPICFTTKPDDSLEAHTYPAYNRMADAQEVDGTFQPVALHYAINRPAGAQWGESDLAPLLTWLRRYSAWLEDRVRLNRFRNAFLYVITGHFGSEEARKARQATLAAHPPSPGSILVCDESETWSVISPKLEAMDAMQDGLAIKKLIAAGVGLPLHFLAEPEDTNRSTAESAGGPTFRRFEGRQQFFLWMLQDVLSVVLARRALVDSSVDPMAEIQLTGADISARDNVSHSIAAVNMMNAVERLRDMGLIGDRELLRIVYRFAGEGSDLDAVLSDGTGEDRRAQSPPISPATKKPVDPASGVIKTAVLP